MTKWIIKTNGLYVRTSKEDTPHFHKAKLFDTEAKAEKFAYVNVGVTQSAVIKVLLCDNCQEKIDNTYYESKDFLVCEECSEALMSVEDQLGDGVFVHHNQYKDVYQDDEISDLELFHRKEKENDK